MRIEGLEPPRLTALVPKTSVAAITPYPQMLARIAYLCLSSGFMLASVDYFSLLPKKKLIIVLTAVPSKNPSIILAKFSPAGGTEINVTAKK